MTTHRILVLHQALVIPTQTDEEQDARHVLEAMYPLSPFRLLPSNIDHQHLLVTQIEDRFRNPNRPRFTSDDILLRRIELRVE